MAKSLTNSVNLPKFVIDSKAERNDNEAHFSIQSSDSTHLIFRSIDKFEFSQSDDDEGSCEAHKNSGNSKGEVESIKNSAKPHFLARLRLNQDANVENDELRPAVMSSPAKTLIFSSVSQKS